MPTKGKRNWTNNKQPLVVNMPLKERLELTKVLIKDTFIEHKKVLDKWKLITGQPSNVDSGYIAQHFISLLTAIPGEGLRGKGIDLGDGSEIKSACCVGGIDIPRWNFNFTKEEHMESFLKLPMIYFVLFDEKEDKLRIRVWATDPDKDEGFCKVFNKWKTGERKSKNFQLHPPVKKDSNITTNLCGNLELPLIYEARENEIEEIDIVFFDPKKEMVSKYIERT